MVYNHLQDVLSADIAKQLRITHNGGIPGDPAHHQVIEKEWQDSERKLLLMKPTGFYMMIWYAQQAFYKFLFYNHKTVK